MLKNSNTKIEKGIEKERKSFAVFIVNSRGEMLLQKRSRRVEFSAGRWSNACFGHVPAGDSPLACAHRQLRSELSFDCTINEIFSEGDVSIFLGVYERNPKPAKKLVADWKWTTLSRIERDLLSVGEAYARWFKKLFPRVSIEIMKRKKTLILRDYVSTADVMRDLYRIPNDVSERWLHE